MDAFNYRGGELFAEGVALSAIAERFGTPTYVYDAAGKLLLDEYAPARRLTPVTIEGQPWLATRVQFNRGTDEGLYGLGQHQIGRPRRLPRRPRHTPATSESYPPSHFHRRSVHALLLVPGNCSPPLEGRARPMSPLTCPPRPSGRACPGATARPAPRWPRARGRRRRGRCCRRRRWAGGKTGRERRRRADRPRRP